MRSAAGIVTSSTAIPYLAKSPSSLATQTGASSGVGVFSPKRIGTSAGAVAGGRAASGAPALPADGTDAALGAGSRGAAPPPPLGLHARRDRATSPIPAQRLHCIVA